LEQGEESVSAGPNLKMSTPEESLHTFRKRFSLAIVTCGTVLVAVIPRSKSDQGSAVFLDSRKRQIPHYARVITGYDHC